MASSRLDLDAQREIRVLVLGHDLGEALLCCIGHWSANSSLQQRGWVSGVGSKGPTYVGRAGRDLQEHVIPILVGLRVVDGEGLG